MGSRLAVVTASLDLYRSIACLASWAQRATGPLDIYVIVQDGAVRDWVRTGGPAKGGDTFAYHSREILGVVPAFALGVQKALEDGAEIIACLHDDLLIEEDGWDETVIRLFKACPRAGLCGFGGGKGLGSDDIYQTPYNPMQLARQGFISNMRDAEAHGSRVEVAVPVACLDGFSQIGTRAFWFGQFRAPVIEPNFLYADQNLFAQMAKLGVVHHFYDGMLGCFAKRLGWQTWFLPVKCHHFGGRTAVGDQRYTAWADHQAGHDTGFNPLNGDQQFWHHAHEVGYNQFKDVLPIRT